MIQGIRTALRRLGRGVMLTLLALLMLLALRHSSTQLNNPYYAIAAHVQHEHFDYIGWELAAIRAKLGQGVAGTHAYLAEADRADLVRAYFADLATIQGVEAQIERIYTDPNINDPAAASADYRAQRDALRADLKARQTLVEAIIESQVSAVIAEAGFGLGGQVFPPVWMHFTQRTMLVVASPRDKIDMRYALTVEPIPVDQREQIEQAIFAEEDLASVIVPIGGMALYPAMIVESSSISWIVETFAHEWFHHYLMFYPLGWATEFTESGEARIINETAASIFGREIAQEVLLRYYPDLAPPPPDPSPAVETDTPTVTPPPEPHFRYDREMNITRITTDKLLAKGNVEAAEAYMEARRQLFVSQGIGIRKLNQAWFSFYGGYQVAGISAGGEDPTGAAVQKLRDEAATLQGWVLTIRGITTRGELLALAG